MQIECIKGSELSPALAARWRKIQLSNRHLASPFFCPEFTSLVAGIRNDVYVAILQDEGEIVGFFPFQRGRLGYGSPVGTRVSDSHGVIAGESLQVDAFRLIKDCRLSSWSFDHLPYALTAFQNYTLAQSSSPIINLDRGLAAYDAAKREQGSNVIKKTATALRRLERDCGTVRIEHDVADPGVLELLLDWKSEQYHRTGVTDLFASCPWTKELLRAVHRTRTDSFCGSLSCLWVQDTPIAIHLGMRSHRAWHWWFPSYDTNYARHSPGMILLWDAIQSAPGLGMAYIDLGKGESDYKSRFSNDSIPLAEGAVLVPSAKLLLRRWLGPCRQYVERGLEGAKEKLKGSEHTLLSKPVEFISRLERRLHSGNPWK